MLLGEGCLGDLLNPVCILGVVVVLFPFGVEGNLLAVESII